MKIEENFLNAYYEKVYPIFQKYSFQPNGILDDIHFYLINFHPKGELRLPSATLLKVCNSYYYGFTFKCLADGSLQLVQDPGNELILLWKKDVKQQSTG